MQLLMTAGDAADPDTAWCYRSFAEALLFGPPIDGEDELITQARREARRRRDFALCVLP
jgi:hypothetical protein